MLEVAIIYTHNQKGARKDYVFFVRKINHSIVIVHSERVKRRRIIFVPPVLFFFA